AGAQEEAAARGYLSRDEVAPPLRKAEREARPRARRRDPSRAQARAQARRTGRPALIPAADRRRHWLHIASGRRYRLSPPVLVWGKAMTAVTAVPLRPLARGSVLKLWVGLAVLAAIAIALAWWGTSGQQVITTASGLRYQVIEEGQGDPMTARDLARVTYVGRTLDGRVFDSTDMHGGEPMVAGVEGMIPGFAEGLQLMREGGT